MRNDCILKKKKEKREAVGRWVSLFKPTKETGQSEVFLYFARNTLRRGSTRWRRRPSFLFFRPGFMALRISFFFFYYYYYLQGGFLPVPFLSFSQQLPFLLLRLLSQVLPFFLSCRPSLIACLLDGTILAVGVIEHVDNREDSGGLWFSALEKTFFFSWLGFSFLFILFFKKFLSRELTR